MTLSVVDLLELFVVSGHDVPLPVSRQIRTKHLKPPQNPSKSSLLGPESCSVSVYQDCPKALRPALAPDSGKRAAPNNNSASYIHTIGIDLGKTVFHLVGLNRRGEVMVRKRCSRTQLLQFTPKRVLGRVHTSESHAADGTPRFIWLPRMLERP